MSNGFKIYYDPSVRQKFDIKVSLDEYVRRSQEADAFQEAFTEAVKKATEARMFDWISNAFGHAEEV